MICRKHYHLKEREIEDKLSELVMEDYMDEDAFLLALVNRKELDSTEVNEIDKRTYCDMTEK